MLPPKHHAYASCNQDTLSVLCSRRITPITLLVTLAPHRIRGSTERNQRSLPEFLSLHQLMTVCKKVDR
jgi:hypothetical protein